MYLVFALTLEFCSEFHIGSIIKVPVDWSSKWISYFFVEDMSFIKKMHHIKEIRVYFPEKKWQIWGH